MFSFLALEEVKEVNKKISMLTVMLLSILVLTIVPAHAAPKEKRDFELYIEGISVSYGPWGTYHAGPRGTEDDNPDPKDLIQRTFHAKAVEFMPLHLELNIAGEDPLIWDFATGYYDFGFVEEHSFNFVWKTLTGVSKANDTLIFYESDGTTVWGTLEISVRDKFVYVFDNQGGLADLVSEGNIFGKGTGALKDAKVAGTTSGSIAYWIPMQNPDTGEWMDVQVMGLTREGTITGWTTPP